MTIASWDPNSPSSTSPAGQGDDEIRAIKADVQAVFPALTTEIQKGVGGAPPTSVEFSQLFSDVEVLKGNAGVLPIGLIVMWSGVEADIPEGFAICDGNNVNNVQVPDLRNRFILASGNTAINAVGGSGTTNTAGAFTATVTVDPHTIQTNNLPRHQHQLFADGTNTVSGAEVDANEAAAVHNDGGGGDDQKYQIAPNPSSPTTIQPLKGRTGWGQSVGATPVDLLDTPDQLTHSSAQVEADGHTHDFTPKFYCLAFIIYVGVT